ncbi:hypothetical protein NQ176_g5939 [Zarea fungicola]|uniref:Uncharacterized protein n=1 Tax=Zarea fungicola TaxID=93591 RepID=A0ACC1N856_9HYPO|nr:hypothetical protein NQ176_g5939 [Lecanicillium fungicola]
MAFAIYKNSTQLAQLIVLLIFSPLTILCLVLRFVATRRTKRKLGFEDWMAVLATIFAILNNLFALLAIGVLNGRQIIDEVKQSPQDYTAMRKYDIVSIYMFFGHIVTVKLSILAFYRRIFGIRVAYLRAIYTLGALQIIVTTIFIILQGFQCRPLARYWDLSVPGTCWPEITIIFGGSLPDSLIDFGVVILCMVMIKSLQISPQLKRRLRILFGIGFLVGIIGLIKMGVTYSTNPVFALSMVSIWTAIQMFFSILCAW